MRGTRIPLLTSARRRRLLWEAAAVVAAGATPSWALAVPAGAGKPAAVPRPPKARIEPVSETFFGETVVDPYRWMENPKDKDWEPFMRGQDAHARAVLAAILGRDLLARRAGELSSGIALAYGVQKAGSRIFYQVRPAGADNFKLAVRAAAAAGAPGDDLLVSDGALVRAAAGRGAAIRPGAGP